MRSSERFQNNTKMLFWFLRGSKRYFAVSALSAVLLAFFGLINPRVIGYTVDSVIGTEPADLPAVVVSLIEQHGGRDFLRSHLYIIAAVVVICAFLEALSRILYRVSNQKGAEKLVRTIRDDLYGHIIRLPFAWHGKHQTGDIIQRCTSDVETIKAFLQEQLVLLFRFVVLMVMAIVFMFHVSVPLTLIAILFIPVIVGNSLLFHKRIGKSFENVDIQEGKLSAIAQENLTGVRVVRAFGRERYERTRFETQNQVFADSDMSLSRIFVLFWSIGSFLSRAQILVIVAAGAAFCVSGNLTSGHYIEFIGYSAMLTQPVRMLGRVISQMSKTGVSIERLRYIMNAKEETDEADAADVTLTGDITFDHVSFSYPGGVRVLDDVSFTIGAGTTVGILGGTGAGKSTLMYLLEHLYDPEEGSGRILIGGTDIRNIRRDHLRRNIGMVLQEPYLFSRTLGENIGVALPAEDTEAVKRATRIAALEETVENLTDGFDTMVGERGVTLSGGQKQRVAIAQMLVRKPPVMIFDDSLSAVDAETDSKIRKALKEETASSTVILIAHRITTLMHADRILVLDKGKVAESGTHNELIAHNGLYRKIFDLQLQKDADDEY